MEQISGTSFFSGPRVAGLWAGERILISVQQLREVMHAGVDSLGEVPM